MRKQKYGMQHPCHEHQSDITDEQGPTWAPSKKIHRTGTPLRWSAQYRMKPSDLVHTWQGRMSTVSAPRYVALASQSGVRMPTGKAMRLQVRCWRSK